MPTPSASPQITLNIAQQLFVRASSWCVCRCPHNERTNMWSAYTHAHAIHKHTCTRTHARTRAHTHTLTHDIRRRYVNFPAAADTPAWQLKGFNKTVALAAGASTTVEIVLDPLDLSIWDPSGTPRLPTYLHCIHTYAVWPTLQRSALSARNLPEVVLSVCPFIRPRHSVSSHHTTRGCGVALLLASTSTTVLCLSLIHI